MHRWAFPRSAPVSSIFFAVVVFFPPRSGEWTAGRGDKDSRVKTWPRSPAAVTGAKCRATTAGRSTTGLLSDVN